jgi:Rrf2 family protein
MAQRSQNGPLASHDIADERGIPKRFLLKVLKPLVNNNILVSVKGPHGGYRLARPASEISVLEVIEAADGGVIRGYAPERPTEKDEQAEYTPAQIRKFEQVWKTLHPKLEQICVDTAAQTRKQLEKVHISDLLAKKPETRKA